MSKIKIYTLSDCGVCKNYKSMLSNERIQFSEYVCDSDDKHCDALESLCNCEIYPITKYTQSYINMYLVITRDITKRNTNIKIDDSTYIYYLDSINNVVNVIKNL